MQKLKGRQRHILTTGDQTAAYMGFYASLAWQTKLQPIAKPGIG